MVVASKSHRDQATDDYIGRYAVRDMTSAGSLSLKFCLVAAGEADLYPRLGRTMEWDTAVGDAVLRGAGGEMVRFDDHSAFTYGKPGFENPFFIGTMSAAPLGHVGPGNAHGHADIGFFQRGSIIDAIAGHGGYVAFVL